MSGSSKYRASKPCRRTSLAARLGALVCVAVLVPLGACSATSAESVAHTAVAEQGVPEIARPAEAALDCKGDEFEVDLLDALSALPEGTEEAQREQLRDWLWSATLGQVSKQTSVEDVFAGVSDEPAVRDESLSHVLRLPTGPTRSTVTKRGEMLVLADASSGASLHAEVLDAIDEQMLSFAEPPARVRVYAFEIKPKTAFARVCRIDDFDQQRLESPQEGYRAATVTSASELDEFLSEGTDLLGAACSESGLKLLGRVRHRVKASPITSEHVAALATKLKERYIPPSQFGKSVDSLSGEFRRFVQSKANQLDELLANGAQEELRRELYSRSYEPGIGPLLNVLNWKSANPSVPTVDLMLSAELQAHFDGKPGFSLDPTYTRAAVIQTMDGLMKALPGSDALVALLRSWGLTARDAESYRADQKRLTAARGVLEKARATLLLKDDDSVLDSLWQLELNTTDSIASSLLREARTHSGRQCARYDGPLAGTQAGMTFFYTDLNAKFFAMDFNRSSPEGTIRGFESIVGHVGSAATCTKGEQDRPATRIWFGLRKEGLSREQNGSVRFGPTATRLFAKGSAHGEDEKETEPNADSRRFIRWWDTHYRAVSEWDPQYESLNQLLKWSTVVQQARIVGRNDCLGFLKDTNVSHDQRLTTWVSARPELRSSRVMARLQPTPVGAECLPLLRSDSFRQCGESMLLSGGVSAAGLDEVRSLKPRPATSRPWFERIAAAKEATTDGEHVRFSDIERASGGKMKSVELSGAGPKVTFKAAIDPNMGQVGADTVNDARYPITTVEKRVEQHGNALEVVQNDNHLLLGGITAYDVALARVTLAPKIGALQRAKIAGQKLATKMQRDSKSLAEAAKSFAGTHDVFDLGEDGVAFRFADDAENPTIALMSSGDGERGPPGDLVFTVGVPDGGRVGEGQVLTSSRPLWVKVYDGGKANRYLAEHGTKLAATNAKHHELIAHFRAALDQGNVREATRLAKTALPLLDEDAIAEFGNAVRRARVLEARAGQADELDSLEVTLAVEARRASAVSPGEVDATKAATAMLTPASFPAEARLPPPPIYARRTPLKPDQHFVGRVLEIPDSALRSEAVVTASGETYQVGRIRQATRTAGGRVGSGLRLARSQQIAIAAVPCSDREEDRRTRPRCTEPAPVFEQNIMVILEVLACPGQSDPRCRKEFHACDLDQDEALDGPRELDCAKKVRAKYQPRDGATSAP